MASAAPRQGRSWNPNSSKPPPGAKKGPASAKSTSTGAGSTGSAPYTGPSYATGSNERKEPYEFEREQQKKYDPSAAAPGQSGPDDAEAYDSVARAHLRYLTIETPDSIGCILFKLGMRTCSAYRIQIGLKEEQIEGFVKLMEDSAAAMRGYLASRDAKAGAKGA